MRELRLRPSRFLQLLNTKSSSLTKQITHQTTFNSLCLKKNLLRSLLVTVASSSPVTTKNKIIQPLHSRCGSWILLSVEKTNNPSPSSSKESKKSSEERVSFEPKVLSDNLIKNISLTGDVSSMSVGVIPNGKIDAHGIRIFLQCQDG